MTPVNRYIVLYITQLKSLTMNLSTSKLSHAVIAGASLLFVSFTSLAARTVIDQLGRQVTIPDRVNRVVVLQHQTLNLLVQLDAADDVVGVLSSWKKQLGPEFERFSPRLATIPMPGDLTQVNLESLLAEHPQALSKPELR